MKLRAMVLLVAVLLMAALALGACGGSSGSSGGESTVKGLVTKVDTTAKTFTVDASGKTYDFTMTGSSKGDINEIKQHMDQKKEIDVKYKGSSPPYEVVSAD